MSIGAFTAARRDVDDAAEAALGHLVDGRLDQLDRRQHVGVDRLDPLVAVPVAEVARRRPAGVVDQDVDLRAGGERGRPARLGRDVAGDRAHLAAAERAQLRGRRLERLGAARGDDDVDAFLRQRRRAALAEPLARRAHQRPFAFDAEIHAHLHLASSQIPASTSTVPATIQPVNGSPRMTMPIRIVESGPIMPVCAATARADALDRHHHHQHRRERAERRVEHRQPDHLRRDASAESGRSDEELGDAEEARHAGRQPGEAQRAEPLDLLAAGDEVDRVADRAGEDQAGAERDVGAWNETSWPNTSSTPQ